MIDDTKPKTKINLPYRAQDKMAEIFGVNKATISQYLSGQRDTPRAREIRLYALNEMDGRYINVVKPKASN